jgi:hypothetical protein
MVDFILFVFVWLIFACGFYLGLHCGRTYQTVGAAFAVFKGWLKTRL